MSSNATEITLLTPEIVLERLNGEGGGPGTLRGATIDKTAWLNLVEANVHIWREDPLCHLYTILQYIASPSTTKILPVTTPAETAPILAHFLDLGLHDPSPPLPASETDEVILARLEAQGEYEFVRNAAGVAVAVKPREGDQFRLERENWHPRDAHIVFEEISHTYFLLGDDAGPRRFPGSVSSAYGRYFEHFDAAETVKKNLQRWLSDESKDYHDVAVLVHTALEAWKQGDRIESTLTKVLEELWAIKNNRCKASEKGTAMHLALELRLNGVPEEQVAPHLVFEDGEVTLPPKQYESMQKAMRQRGWKPFRTEWSIFDTEAVLSGQIDSLWQDGKGNIHMADFKRCSKADLGPAQRAWRNGTGPCADLPDTDFFHYSMQQCLYARILERQYDISISSMCLLHFHPTVLGDDCRIVDIPTNLKKFADLIIEERIRELGTQPEEHQPEEHQQIEDTMTPPSPKRAKSI